MRRALRYLICFALLGAVLAGAVMLEGSAPFAGELMVVG